MNKARCFLLGLGLLALLLAACTSLLGPVPDHTSYFILTPIAASGAPASAGAGLTLGVGEIHLPDYLNRREMVTRVDANRLEISSNDLWAEPLNAAVRSVLGQDLAQLLGPARILNYPWYSNTHIDYAVTVNASNFQCDAQGRCQLDAQWSINNPAGQMVRRERSAIGVAASAKAASAQAAALSQALGQMSRQIADAIAQASQTRAALH